MLGKAVDRVVEALPLPIVFAVAAVVLGAFGIRLFDETLSWRQVLLGSAFQILALATALALAGYYGVKGILRVQSDAAFAATQRGLVIADFDGDSESLVRSLTFERLRTEIHDALDLIDVRVAKANHAFTEHEVARQYCARRQAQLCIWGAFTKPLIHANISAPNTPKYARFTSQYPDVDNLTSSVLSLLRSSAPFQGHPAAAISYLEQQVSELQQQNAQLRGTVEQLSKRLSESSSGGDEARGTLNTELRRQRIALFIGADRFQDDSLPALATPSLEARRLSESLRQVWPQTEVTLLLGEYATRYAVLHSFESAARQARADDQLWFFFSGHSMLREGELLLLLHDTKTPPVNSIGNVSADTPIDSIGAVSTDDLIRIASTSPAKQIVLILDTSQSGVLAGRMQHPGPQAIYPSTQSVLVLTSAGAAQLAVDASEFVPSLTEGIAGAADYDGDGLVSGLELYEYIRERMRRSAARDFMQMPFYFVSNQSYEIILGRRA